MKLSIIIPTKDRGEVFDQTLRCVANSIQHLDAEIIVVNDSKTSRPIIPVGFSNITLIDNPKSGVASARNLGALNAKADLIFFMDDDFLVPANAIAQAVELASQDERKIHLFNWVYPPVLNEQLNHFQFGRYLTECGFTTLKGWLGDEWRDDVVFELKDGASYFLPIKKSVFTEIGGYNETFPHAGAEDYDFVQRAKEKGVRFYVDKRYTLFHNERDRIDLKNWLRRKERNGETVRLAFQIGHKKVAIHYSMLKRFILKFLNLFRWVFFAVLKLIPNNSLLDPLYFKLTNILLAIYIYRGYMKND